MTAMVVRNTSWRAVSLFRRAAELRCQGADKPNAIGFVVTGTIRFKLAQEPQALLGKRKRRHQTLRLAGYSLSDRGSDAVLFEFLFQQRALCRRKIGKPLK
jgi:hypothetical protein